MSAAVATSAPAPLRRVERNGQRVRVEESGRGYEVTAPNAPTARAVVTAFERWAALAPDLPLERMIERSMVTAAITVRRPAELPRGEALHRAANPRWSERQVAERALFEAECAARRRARRGGLA